MQILHWVGVGGSFTGGQAVIQKDIDRLEEESSRDLMRLSAAECRVLALVWEDILLLSRLGINWLKSNFVKKDLRAPVDNRGNMSQQCAAVAVKKTPCITSSNSIHATSRKGLLSSI